MASMLLQTNKTQGNYEQVFSFTLDASFNGITGDIDDAKIQIFFPLNIETFINPPTSPVKEISEQPTQNGKIVTFNIGKIEDLGVALRIEFGAKFSLDTPSGEIFSCTPEMIINGNVETSASAQITLVVQGNFVVNRQIVLPESPCAGSEIYYEVVIENIGDKWATLGECEIRIFGNENLALDTAYEVLGKDISPSAYADKSSDGVLGVFAENSLVFKFLNYRGTKYRFFYRAIASASLDIGSVISSAAIYTIDGETSQDDTNFTLSAPFSSVNVSLYGADYTLGGEYICYETIAQNSGNLVLENAAFTWELPAQCEYYELGTGLFYVGAIGEFISSEYTLEYETRSGITGVVGTFNINTNSAVDLSSFLPENDNLFRLFWRFGAFGIGMKTLVSPRIKGIVSSSVPLLSSLLCEARLSYTSSEGEKSTADDHITLVDDICTLRPRFSSSKNNANLRPLDELAFTIGANCNGSRLINPVFAIILPSQFEYVGVSNVRYNDIFEGINPQIPPAIVTENFNPDGETLVKFEFVGEYAYSFNQKCLINIFLNVRVRIGAIGTAESFSLLNSQTQSAIAGDTYESESVSANYFSLYAKSNSKQNLILFTASVRADNKVRGALDTAFVEEPIVAKTFEGGSVLYKLSVTNIGNATFDRIEMVGILPHSGDTAVLSQSPRNSEFSVYNIAEISASKGGISAFYSKSYDPVRFGSTFNTIGTVDDWSTSAPDDITKLRSFKIVSEGEFSPNETLEVTLLLTAPAGVAQNAVAWNSFSALINYKDANNNPQRLLPIEPEKVGVRVELPPNPGKVCGFVWLDDDLDGKFSDDEIYVDEVGVALYDENKTLVCATFTTPNADGTGGQFLLNNIPNGKYFLRFFIDERTHKFTVKTEDGSEVDSRGISEFFTVDSQKTVVIAGIRDKTRHTIDEILAVNRSARGMMRNVIKNEMLIVMKHEDVLTLIDK